MPQDNFLLFVNNKENPERESIDYYFAQNEDILKIYKIKKDLAIPYYFKLLNKNKGLLYFYITEIENDELTLKIGLMDLSNKLVKEVCRASSFIRT